MFKQTNLGVRVHNEIIQNSEKFNMQPTFYIIFCLCGKFYFRISNGNSFCKTISPPQREEPWSNDISSEESINSQYVRQDGWCAPAGAYSPRTDHVMPPWQPQSSKAKHCPTHVTQPEPKQICQFDRYDRTPNSLRSLSVPLLGSPTGSPPATLRESNSYKGI